MAKLQSDWINSKNIFLLLLGIGLMYVTVTSMIDSRFKEIELNTRVQIADQEVVLAAIAETTARNGADKVTESIVRDCSLQEKSRFNTLLSSLDKGLGRAELSELDRLFGRCGSFDSDRKTVMVSRLVREIEVYEAYVNQLSLIEGEELADAFMVSKWKELAVEEQKQSELFAQLVGTQDEIISALLDGSSADSVEIREILQQANEVKQSLYVANEQATRIRSELVSL